ncbi:probable transcription factor BTF3a [Serendipita indica DSM 11827]|uniref:Nascent polypeptide-associated complex subunit beta n=1 Tax=Serendipita indica (strain DSM 11827) TaxID=1109443 RepID=G4TRS1_SERID|nr:probable transcription factor BTF3a [Serendipita indica DSM 11827]
MPVDAAKLAKLQAQAASTRIGGKGTPRRKVVKTAKAGGGQDDRKLQAALKKLNMQPITGVEELNMFREDGNVLHFSAPKGNVLSAVFSLYYTDNVSLSLPVPVPLVHGAPAANTFAVYGTGQVKELTELVPGILNQLGPDSLASLRKLAESYQAIQQGQRAAAGATKEEDDDDVPDLVESFDVPDTAAGETKKDADLEELN